MKKVFILGTGNIGKRHLQAIANSQYNPAVYCYDINRESLNSVNAFCESNNIEFNKLNTYNSLPELVAEIDKQSIVIVATTAQGRLELFETICRYTPKAIIVEKPVAQNLADYQKIVKFAEGKRINIYVNFIAHAQSFYQDIYKELENQMSFSMYTAMPQWGLSTVGIHQIELFLWLARLTKCNLSFSNFLNTYEQKRKGFYDITGSIVLEENGKLCLINNFYSDEIPSSIQIILKDKTVTINESINKLIITTKSGIETRDLNVTFVSQYINHVVDSIWEDDKVILPTIQESFWAHKILFEYTKKHKVENLNIT